MCGSGNYARDEAKEYPERMAKILYTATSEYVDEIKALPVKRQVSVSGTLLKLAVSRSGCNAWKTHTPSEIEICRGVLKKEILDI